MLPWCARLAMLLPREGRTLRVALRILAVFAVFLLLNYLYVQAYGKTVTLLSMLLVGGLAVSFYCLFVLLNLASMRRLIRLRDQNPKLQGKTPILWFPLLWPYRKEDIERIDTQGRLAELMTFTFILISVVGLTLAVVLPH